MTAQTARTDAARKRTGPKQRNKQISARKKLASSRHNGKYAKRTRQPRTLRQAKKQHKREGAVLRERVNGNGRDHHDEQVANQQVTSNYPLDLVSERTSATQGSIDREQGRPASSDDPQQQGMQPKERLDDAVQANGAGLRLTHPSMLPMHAIAMAHWQFWATAMAAYPRAWISVSPPRLGRH
jgi:hypothetical protein